MRGRLSEVGFEATWAKQLGVDLIKYRAQGKKRVFAPGLNGLEAALEGIRSRIWNGTGSQLKREARCDQMKESAQ